MNQQENDIVVINCGNRTPLGTRTGVTAASIRARFSVIALHRDFMDEYLNPIRLGVAEYLDEDLNHYEQFRDLALPALIECLSPLKDLEPKPAPVKVIVGLPELRPGILDLLGTFLLKPMEDLRYRFGFELDVKFIYEGHTSILRSLVKDDRLQNEAQFMVVGGVESYVDGNTLEWLEKDARRLFCTDNKNGFIPGQAAGFCLLSSRNTARKHGLPIQARLVSSAIHKETNGFETGKNSTGEALTRCIEDVAQDIPKDTVFDQVYCTLNGEPYYTMEYSYAAINIAPRIPEINEFIAPFNSWGDIGAAAVPVLISLATEAGRKNYAKGPLNLITAANLGGTRGAILLNLENLTSK